MPKKETTSKKTAKKTGASKKSPASKAQSSKGGKIVPAKKSSGHALSKSDPMQAYMRDVHRYPLLTPEQEYELAVNFVKTGDVDAAKKLITSNLRLVVKIAYEYRRAYRNILDLVQEGNIGLMQAVKKFDPYKGVKLSSYSAWWIRAYILRFILNNWRLVKIGTTQAQRKLFFNLQKEKNRLSAMGIEATPENIADSLNVTKDEVIMMDRRLSSGEVSLDAPARSDDDGTGAARIDFLPSEIESTDSSIAEDEMMSRFQEKITEFGKTLDGKELIIFQKRLLSEEPLTLQEIGLEFGVTRERVRQIEKRLLEKIRSYLSRELNSDEFEVFQESAQDS